MVKSLFVTASAGSGKTFRLTQEVRRHIERDTEFVVAATFTRAAAAEMEKRILEAIEKGEESPADKLRLIMRAARVHFSTIDALFHRFLSTEAYCAAGGRRTRKGDHHRDRRRALFPASGYSRRHRKHPDRGAHPPYAARVADRGVGQGQRGARCLGLSREPACRAPGQTGAPRRRVRAVAGQGAGRRGGNKRSPAHAGGRPPPCTARRRSISNGPSS